MLDQTIVPTFNPELYYTRQLRGNTHYPIYQSGRGLGSRLFNIVKSVGAPLLKDVILHSDSTRNVFENLACFFLYGRKNDIYQEIAGLL